MTRIVHLIKPITAHGEEVVELEFREPTSEDVMEIGMPNLLVPNSDSTAVGVEVRTKVVGQYITRLAKVPPSSVKSLALSDFFKCQSVVMNFFYSGDGEA